MENDLPVAISLINSGKLSKARTMLENILSENQENDLAWCALSLCFTKEVNKVYCLTKAISINPNNVRAKKLLEGIQNHDSQNNIQFDQKSLTIEQLAWNEIRTKEAYQEVEIWKKRVQEIQKLPGKIGLIIFLGCLFLFTGLFFLICIGVIFIIGGITGLIMIPGAKNNCERSLSEANLKIHNLHEENVSLQVKISQLG